MLSHPHGTLPKVEAAIGQTVLQIVTQLVTAWVMHKDEPGREELLGYGGVQGGSFGKVTVKFSDLRGEGKRLEESSAKRYQDREKSAGVTEAGQPLGHQEVNGRLMWLDLNEQEIGA